MTKLKKSQIFNIVVFFIGTVVIISLIRNIGWSQTREHLSRTGWSFFWLFPIYLVTMLGDTVSWRLLIRTPVSMIRVMLVANSGTAINALTPSGDGGEFVKGNLIGPEIGASEAVSSLLLWNFLYAVTKKIVTVAGPLLYLMLGPFDADPRPIDTVVVFWFLGLGLLTALYLPLAYFLVTRIGVERIARRLHRLWLVRRLDLSKVEAFSRQLDETFRDFGRNFRWRLVAAALLLLLVHLSVCFEIWFVMGLLGVEVSWATSVFLFTGSSLLQTVVSLSPVEMGVTEAGSMGLYQWIGFEPVYGFMQEFLRRLRRLVFNFLGLAYLGWCAFNPYLPPMKPAELPEPQPEPEA
jgi:uncharacterized protein (TIRG00374 family)